ncbi:MAG: tryptophan 7-halogenase, partial [Gammaproteobacteria bacterium]
MKVEKICIVGGGTSGWLTAAALVQRVPNIKVTLVESDTVPTIGVGESTLEQFRTFLDFIGISDEDWMAECDATYKTSIGFDNFFYSDKTVHYPFGPVELGDKQNGFDDIFALSCFHDEFSHPLSFQKYYNDMTTVAESNKLFDGIIKNTAYHLDATKFGHWLRDRICVGRVEHIIADVKPVLNTRGIECLTTPSGVIEADLYIDCTGFKSLLLERSLGVEFNEFDNLINN